ncbi:DUF4030 domain-containing protein [Bacillus sp. T33-2]|uniref:DUF4030 domain-containing protein n=1 Tax=Bacillus sp. T33-2 TaxID=2054168 RepID=UPI000C777020|nr:DUF4030 domain-containing protein [Bacillus sp. T33-2]PLR95903.1 hypothetical protein CVD19_12825 [Bacillus sp. T33-2]
MGYKKQENIQSLEHLQVPQSLEKFIAELPDRYENGSIDKEIEEQIDKEWKVFRNGTRNNRVIWKRVAAFSLSAAAAFGLFIGSAFVSPAMAQIVSSIPYLNLLFESKPLGEEIKDTLDQNNYQYGQLGVSIREKEVSVGFEGPVEYYNEVKSPVEDLIKDILKLRNNDAYTVKVFHQPDESKDNQELDSKFEQEAQAEQEKITATVGEVLKQYGYEPNGVGVGEGIIHIDYVPNTEKRLDEMKAQIIQNLKQEHGKDFKVKFYLFDPDLQEREGRLLPLFHTITEGLTAKTEYKVDGAGYSNKKERFYIEVRTTISSSDTDKEEVAAKIEKTIQDFLQSEEAQKAIKDDIYEIIILSKDQKTLKTIKN